MDAGLCSPELRVIQFVPVTAFLTKGDRRHPSSRLEPSLVTAFPSEAAVSIGGAHWTDRQTDKTHHCLPHSSDSHGPRCVALASSLWNEKKTDVSLKVKQAPHFSSLMLIWFYELAVYYAEREEKSHN